MEIFHYKIKCFDIYVTITNTIHMTVHKDNEIINTYNELIELTLKNFNLFFLKFTVKVLSYTSLQSHPILTPLIQKLISLSNLFVKLEYNVVKDIIIKFFILFSKYYVEVKKNMNEGDYEYLTIVYEMIYMKSFLNYLINN